MSIKPKCAWPYKQLIEIYNGQVSNDTISINFSIRGETVNLVSLAVLTDIIVTIHIIISDIYV